MIRIPTRPHGVPAFQYTGNLLVVAERLQQIVDNADKSLSIAIIPLELTPYVSHYMQTVCQADAPALGLKCKPVARRVRPVAMTMPANCVPKRRFPGTPLHSLTAPSPHPPLISVFGIRLTEERWKELKVGQGLLSEEELKLAFAILKDE